MSAPLSSRQKEYAKILYARGVKQSDIAKILRCDGGTVSRMKQPDWDDLRLPQLSYRELIDLVKDDVTRLLIDLVVEKIPVEGRSNARKDVRMLSSAMESFQNQVDDVDLRDLMLSLQKHMEWLATQTGGQEALALTQQHYEELKKKL
jgi:hypothetical protein